jgi:hypothetical protein
MTLHKLRNMTRTCSHTFAASYTFAIIHYRKTCFFIKRHSLIRTSSDTIATAETAIDTVGLTLIECAFDST